MYALELLTVYAWETGNEEKERFRMDKGLITVLLLVLEVFVAPQAKPEEQPDISGGKAQPVVEEAPADPSVPADQPAAEAPAEPSAPAAQPVQAALLLDFNG